MSTDDDREALIWRLTDEFRSYQRATDAFDEEAGRQLGINRTDARCLDVLHQHGRMTAGELAAQTGLTTGAVTGVLDRLERAGHLARTRDEADRRRVLVQTTPAFDAWAAEVYGPLGEKGFQVLEPFSDDELERMIDFIRLARQITDERAAELRATPPRGRPPTPPA